MVDLINILDKMLQYGPHFRVDNYNDSPDITLKNIKALSKAEKHDVSYCDLQGDAAVKGILESRASVIVCDIALNNEPPLTEMKDEKLLVCVAQPRLWMARMLKTFFVPDWPEIIIEPDGHIDPFGSIGLPGFGYMRNERGELEHFPHYGGVRIGRFVDIGASTCIDRATLPNEYTTIGDGCKIDNLVHIGHNATIGSNCVIVSHCNIGGSCTIGDSSYLGMSVVINDHINLGKRVAVGSGSLVVKDLPDNIIAWGNPIDHKFSVDLKPEWTALVGPKVS